MEKKQLNLNAPLLSVRKFSSPSDSSELVKLKVMEKPLPSRQQSLPLYKSEWEDISKPAAVPFHWEQIPGRPKDEIETWAHSPIRSSSAPRLPPARVSDALRSNSCEIAKLPPKRSSGRYNSGDQNIYRPQVESFAFSDHASLLEKLSKSLNCDNDGDSESGDDELYSDALETLSLAESWTLNYSVSGVSGCQSSGAKPSGTFSVDTQTRDYMMDRFLPAAKAVVLETPQYVAKKTPAVVNEEPKPIKKAVSKEQKSSIKQYDSETMMYYSRHMDNVESDGDHKKNHDPVKKLGKAWGFMPRFCVKNSLCLLNPLPRLKSKPQTPMPHPPGGRIQRVKTRNAHSGPIGKSVCHVPQKKKFHSGLLPRDHQEIENKSTIDLNHFLNSRDSYRSEVSPLRRYRSGNISPFRNESPKPSFGKRLDFLGVPKEVENNKIASSRKLFKALQDVSRTPMRSGPVGNNDSKKITETSPVHKIHPIPNPSQTRKGVEVVLPVLDSAPIKLDRQGLAESKQESESGNRRESDPPTPFKSPLPPPLPKSPSESWLWRTLPSIPLGNPFSASRRRNHIHPKEGQKYSTSETKWETIVKSSNIRQDHVRYSEELRAHGSH